MGGACDYSQITMNFFAKWNSLWPFTVNVSGKKAKLINSIGNAVAPKANHVDPFGIVISTKNHACASIIRYAPYNFFYDFHKSNLGIFMTLECHENSQIGLMKIIEEIVRGVSNNTCASMVLGGNHYTEWIYMIGLGCYCISN